MKWIEIKPSDHHKKVGGVAQPPAVSISGSTFTLNNLAIAQLSKIWGSADFSLKMMVSECGGHIAFGAKESERNKTGLPKAITSRSAKDMLVMSQPRYRKLKVPLKLDGEMLVGAIN